MYSLICLIFFVEFFFPTNGRESAIAKFNGQNGKRMEGYFTFTENTNGITIDVEFHMIKMDKMAQTFEIYQSACVSSFKEVPVFNQEKSKKDRLKEFSKKRSKDKKYTDNKLKLSGNSSIIGGSVVILDKNDDVWSCANITNGSRIVGYARFDEGTDLSGVITLVQYFDQNKNQPANLAIDLIGNWIGTVAKSYCILMNDTGCDSNQHCNSLTVEKNMIPGQDHYVNIYEDPKLLVKDLIGKTIIVKIKDQPMGCIKTKIYGSRIWPKQFFFPTGPDEIDPNYYTTEGKNWMPYVVLGYIVLIVVVIAVWVIYRMMIVRDKISTDADTGEELKALHNEGKMEKKGDIDFEISVEEDMKLHPLKKHFLGEVSYGLMHSFSVSLFLLYFFLVVDYYYDCQFITMDSHCMYGSYPIFSYKINGDIFFGLWLVFAVWFIFQLSLGDRMKNLFRVPCTFLDAEWLLIQVDEKNSILTTLYPSPIVKKVRQWRERCIGKSKRKIELTVKVMTEKSNGEERRYFTFRCTRFVYNNGKFCKFQPSIGKTMQDLRNNVPLSTEEVNRRSIMTGPNAIPYYVDSFAKLLKSEFASFFYFYQLLVYAVWVWWSYLFVAVFMLATVLFAGFWSMYIIRQNQEKIKELTGNIYVVEVKRNDKWQKINSSELVPGDFIKIQGDSWIVVCDLALVEGTAICDESGLTGESKPIQKIPLKESEKLYDLHSCSKYTLFAGTKVLSAGRDLNSKVVGIVLKTGSDTSKGELVKHILFPQKISFKYIEEFDIILVILILYSFIVFAMVNVCLAVNNASKDYITIFCYSIFTMSQTLSPLVPLALVVGQNMSSHRLKTNGVFCVNPNIIPISGKIRVVCFDKTGTLTKEGLDFIGVHELSDVSKPTFKEKPGSIEDFSETLLHGLATCHAVTKYENKLIGQEVEVKMFEATGWNLIEEDGQPTKVSKNGKELKIVKRFEFDHTLMTMSVLVRDPSGRVYVFCKGSAESISGRANRDSLPENYDTISKNHALEGCYVISIGFRDLGDLDDEAIHNLTRDDTEKQLNWLGLILFRNELKPDTAKAIKELKGGNVRCVMITGDNAQCGWYIAKKSGLVKTDATILLADTNDQKTVEWREMTTRPEPSGPFTTEDILNDEKHQDAELACTGKAFSILEDNGQLDKLILRVRVLARMTPQGKVTIIEKFIKEGLIVGMCGDGGNDCGALRTAHVGIALSDAEASVVSPFTSKTKSIQSVVDLLREGKAALTTSFAMYQFLITYGQLFSIVKLCCLGLGVILCNMDYFFFDVIVVMVFSYAMTLSRPHDTLKPQRPTSSLLGPVTVGSIIGVQVIHMIILGIGMGLTTNHPKFVKWPAHLSDAGAWWFLGDNWETTCLFIMFGGHFLNSSIIFSVGGYFRKPVYQNYCLIFFWIIWYLVLVLAYLLPDGPLPRLFHISSYQANKPYPENPIWMEYQNEGHNSSPAMPFDLRLGLVLLVALGSLLSLGWHKYVINGPVANSIAKKYPSKRPVFPTGC